MKRFIFLVMVSFIAVMLVGCKPSSKTFSGSGVEITLNKSFVKKDVIQAPLYLESKDHFFMANRESKIDINSLGISSLQDYIEAVLNISNKTATVKTYDKDGVYYKYAYYTSTVDQQTFGYMMIAMEGDNHFYTMNFGCLEKNLEDSKDQYFEWAKTISVE